MSQELFPNLSATWQPTFEHYHQITKLANMTTLANISLFETDEDGGGGDLHKYVALPLVVLILWTFIGNSFVLIAVYRERNLKSMANYVIASLATADLLLAILVMPLSLYYLVSHKQNNI